MGFYTGRLPEGFCYLPQDTYFLGAPQGVSYLYADSATSCVIVAVTGRDAEGRDIAGLCHLSTPARLEAFLNLAAARIPVGLRLYAQGANPPDAPVAAANIAALTAWVDAHRRELADGVLVLGAGDPNRGHGALGLCVDPASSGYLRTSDDYYHLEPGDRDPRGGLQVLFCKFGEEAGLGIRPYDAPFSGEEAAALIRAARAAGFEEAAALDDGAILARYSTTPAWEPRWFCDRVREAARLVSGRTE